MHAAGGTANYSPVGIVYITRNKQTQRKSWMITGMTVRIWDTSPTRSKLYFQTVWGVRLVYQVVNCYRHHPRHQQAQQERLRQQLVLVVIMATP